MLLGWGKDAFTKQKKNKTKQPKKPQYLYVYLDDDYEFSPIKLNTKWTYIGKIKLEVEEDV